MTIQVVLIEDITIPDIRSNAVYSSEKFEELKLSIAQAGIQFRPSVRTLAEGKYELVDGRHRIQVWRDLGHDDIEVEVETLTDEQALVKHVVANHHRGESDPVGLSKLILKLRAGGKTLEEVGKLIGYSGSQTAQYLQLAYLPDIYQEAVSAGRLKLAHIKEAVRLEDAKEIDAALTYTMQMKWSADVLHHYVQNRVNELQMAAGQGDPSLMNMIQPPAPSPQLAQYRTCLVCGAMGEAHEMFYPALGKECHDTLKYLITIDKNPLTAIQSIVSDAQSLQAELDEKEKKIKELSDRIIDLSLRLMPAAALPPVVRQSAAPMPAEGVQRPDTPWWERTRAP